MTCCPSELLFPLFWPLGAEGLGLGLQKLALNTYKQLAILIVEPVPPLTVM